MPDAQLIGDDPAAISSGTSPMVPRGSPNVLPQRPDDQHHQRDHDEHRDEEHERPEGVSLGLQGIRHARGLDELHGELAPKAKIG